MGGRGAKSSVATNAKLIENMNETQLKREIAKNENTMAVLQGVMNKNGVISASDKAFQEAFPLTAGASKNARQERQEGARTQSKVNRAGKYVKAYNELQSLQKRNTNLKGALKQVKGTGKTQKQISEESVKKSVKNTGSSLKWKQTKEQGQYGATTVRKAGGYTIKSSDGTHFIYKGDKQLGYVNKLSTAKAFVEKQVKGGK